MIICILWFTAKIPKLSYCSLLIKGDFSPINPPGVSHYITMHGVKTFKGSQWELKHRSGSHLTWVLAPSPFLLFLNIGSSPVFTAGEPLCGASAVPALRSEPALSCCSADSTAPSQSPAPGRNLREGRRETDSVTESASVLKWNTQTTAGVFPVELWATWGKSQARSFFIAGPTSHAWRLFSLVD